MANFTVKDVKAIIENLDDDTALWGWIIGPRDHEVFYREPTKSEWNAIVEKIEENNNDSLWKALWGAVSEASSELFPEESDEETE